ncbi:DUF1772 domain-containing protein [uncultured Roseobacter sp.]|uniref:DUF1772 domain-containing protein n=1 Tax=uncultured Roseobacter sp. TaxID=114847 RepID=UPI00261A8142|nr:DUF1772 domain-containing protein [uncultured Roseobacter sp.]
MLDILIILNLTIMGAVYGYAVAASAVAYPAMMATSRATAVEFFAPFFHKSAHMQLVLSLIVLGLSLVISLMGGGWLWLIGGVVLQVSGPYTIKILMPVNNRIMAEGADINSDQMTKDLGSWGRLHFPRTVLATLIFVLFAYLAVLGGA